MSHRANLDSAEYSTSHRVIAPWESREKSTVAFTHHHLRGGPHVHLHNLRGWTVVSDLPTDPVLRVLRVLNHEWIHVAIERAEGRQASSRLDKLAWVVQDALEGTT